MFQDSTSCGGHSSSGSTSSLSTSPSVSQSPPQPQLNGVAAAGALNGVIQTPPGAAGPHTHTTGAGAALPVNSRYVREVGPPAGPNRGCSGPNVSLDRCLHSGTRGGPTL